MEIYIIILLISHGYNFFVMQRIVDLKDEKKRVEFTILS